MRDFYRRRFGVTLADEQVVTTSGSKDAIAQFPMAILNPGDMGIAPSPGYPTYNIGHVFAGAVTYYVAAAAAERLPGGLRRHPARGPPPGQAAVAELPQQPDDRGGRPGLLPARRGVRAAAQHPDRPRRRLQENTYDGYRAPSILQVEGADEVAVEFFSLSKAFSMTGWRAGAMVGNASAVAALRTVKENIDNGTLRGDPVRGGQGPGPGEQIVPPINAVYRRRRDLVVERPERPRLAAPASQRAPSTSGRRCRSGTTAPAPAFATDLLEKTGVVVTPGLGYGQWGEGYFRISLTYPEDVLNEALGRIMEMRL